ncbi:CAP domain-containing protein [Antarcticibacterium flavum]|uniref:CAP domain-containing protein n=1 Tax=Antarcticibacterium flavum TaxID=2058175 RepID=A0A5B7WYJ7_9FLAO|nr:MULTISPECIES: CAP domain-containing protein [Antarcticibacterium]MCM4161214.1 CAP domain-containing protein [Antarcticibacterium sp. W02-3]QCY68284.1 CAP domain-containing protein [Antarcticibacterium flavum]
MYTITKKVCLVLICVLTFSSCATDNDLPADDPIKTANLVDYIAYSSIEKDIIVAVNNYRRDNGLKVLGTLDDITHQAIEHNNYMIANKKVSHDNFNKRYIALVNDIGAKAVSENIGFGYRTAEAVVNAWINSDGHKDNIEGDFTHFGISVEQDEDGKNYFTNIFVKR